MSSTSPRQGLSKTLRSIKARFVVGFTLVLLAAVFSASALTANLNAPLGQTAGSFAANVFSLFGDDRAADKVGQKGPVVGGVLVQPTEQEIEAARMVQELDAPSVVFSNPAPITLLDNGPSSLYPSNIAVSGLSGSVTNVTVTISGINHTWGDDVDIMLVGPGGQSAVLMSDTGGSADFVNHTYTFSNAAGSPLQDSAVVASGTYLPTNFGAGDVFPAPAPASGASSLAVFNGTNPNGTWSLYAIDDEAILVGSITGGWSIDITAPAGTCAAPPANMVAWYPGEVGADDIIGDPANNGTTVGSMFYNTGKVGNGFQMNGTNAFVQVPPSAELNVGAGAGISVDAWINPANTTQAPIVEWNGPTLGAHFWHGVTFAGCPGPGSLFINLRDTAGVDHVACTTSTPVTAGVQQHVAFTYDKATGNVAFYYNGVAQPTNVASLGTGFTPQTGITHSMFLGHRPAPAAFFAGVMDEVEIFNRALSGAEVLSINDAGSIGKCHVSQIQFDLAAQSVPENGGSAVTTLKRVGANDSTATVAYNVADGTATGGGVDYGNASTSIVTFGPGERTQTVSVPIIDDAIDEVDETFTASISLPTGAGVSIGAPAAQVITIVDNDAVPVISINSASGVEGNPGPAGSATFTVTKTGATTLASSVLVTPTSGTATGGATCAVGIDFINTPTTLNFPASLTTDTQTVTVNFCSDTAIEGDETFTMVLTPTGATAGAAGTGTIQDDDSSVQFTAATYSVLEGSGGGTTTVSLSVSRTGTGTGLPAASVDASTIQVGGTATGNNSCAIAGTDYVVISGQTLSWAAGDVANKNLVITICSDNVDEANETLNSMLSNAFNTTIGAQSTAVTTITDDDNPPSFALTPSTTTVAEGATATYTVTRSGNATELSTTVTWTATNGTATAPGDYSGTTGTVTFAPGSGGTQTFTINANNDPLFEGNENFTVALTAATNGSTFSGTNTTTITDTDTAPTVAINDVTQVEGNAGSTAFIFTVTRTGDAQANQTMVASTANGGGPNVPATFPSDYTQIIGDTVTFTQGQTSRQVAVIVNGDTTFEDNENFTVNLAGFNFGSATDGTGLGTITNDDAAPVFTLDADVTVTEGNGGSPPYTNATFTITKTGATELTSIVTASTANGTAVAPGDFNALVSAAVATFAPADTTKTFNVEVVRDSIYESNEGYTVTLNNVTNGTFGANITRNGTITNDETAPTFTTVGTSLSNPEGTSATTTTTMTFPLGTTGTEIASTLTCARTVISGNSTIHAQSGDFSTTSSTLTFAAGSPSGTTQVCTVTTVNDTVFEGDETFTITVTGASNTGTVTGGPFTATITNNDACTFVASNVSQVEGNAGTSNFVHNVTKTCDTGSFNALVSYASSDGTAVNPVDYTEIIPGTLAFLPATTSLPLPVSVNGDLTVEADETYNLLLTGATVNGVPVPAASLTNGLGTILNDDGVPISISGTITNLTPAGPAAGVTVVLSGSSAATTTTNASGQYTFTGLPSGGNFLVTPTAPVGTVASPTTRSYTGITASVTNANFILYPSGAIPRTLNVQNSYTVPGSAVTVPVFLTAQGDESALSFSMAYNSAILSNPTVACGSGSAGCALVANTGTPGQIGVSVEAQDGGGNPTTYAAGTRVVINVTFATAATAAANTPVTFSDVPTLRRTSDAGSNPLPTVYNNGFVVFQQGLEADVANRTSGNGILNSADVIQVRRFVANLDTPDASTNEYQRADSAPAGTKGNGALDAGDVVQVRRYAAALDPTQTAGGPFVATPPPATVEGRGAKASSEAPESVNTVLRLVNVSGNQGSQVFVDVELDSVVGDDVAGFSTTVQFDNTRLAISGLSSPDSNPDVTLGSGAIGSGLTVNATAASAGRIGILVDRDTAFVPGTRQMVRLRFTIAANAPAGPTPVTLVGNPPGPVGQSMSNTLGNPVTFSNQNGAVTVILNPTAAGVTVGGRVTTPQGAGLRGATVSITDGAGVTRTVTTSTFGYYQFEDIEAGGNYVVAVASRRFRFAPRVVQVIDNLSDVDFQGQE